MEKRKGVIASLVDDAEWAHGKPNKCEKCGKFGNVIYHGETRRMMLCKLCAKKMDFIRECCGAKSGSARGETRIEHR